VSVFSRRECVPATSHPLILNLSWSNRTGSLVRRKRLAKGLSTSRSLNTLLVCSIILASRLSYSPISCIWSNEWIYASNI
jgi:hypothetical protein